MRWLGFTGRAAIPSPRKLLRLVYLGRLCLATAIYLSAALKIRVAAPLDILVTSLMLVVAVAVTSPRTGTRTFAPALRARRSVTSKRCSTLR